MIENQYGAGRINAYQALKYTLENYGGTLTQNLTIANGETWNFAPGVTVTFQNGSYLKVDGTLNVNGTSSNKVVFDFVNTNWSTLNGIQINESGTANIDNAIIKNALNGVYVNAGVLNLNNSEIVNCYRGIYLYRTKFSATDPVITNTRITNTTTGVYMYNSVAQLSYNKIDNNYIGISCSYSSPYLATDDNTGNSDGFNEIINNSFGIYASSYSNPFLGRVTCTNFGGNNTIDNNSTKDVNLYNHCTVYAEDNWWGGGPPYYYAGSDCFFDPYPFLYSPPQQEQGAIKITPEESAYNKKFTPQLSSVNNKTELLEVSSSAKLSGYNKKWSIEWKLLYARNLLRVKKYNQAAKICESVITDYPDSARSYLALDLLWQSRKKDKSTQFSQFVKDKAKLKTKKQLYGVAELMLSATEKTKRVSTLSGIESKYKDTPLVEHILFQKFMYYLYEENNIDAAKGISDELLALFPNSESYYASQRHLGNDVRKPLAPQLAKGNLEEIALEMPKNYELLGNYPNPFNPSTTISYALPYSSNVELTIYDITGKVVKTFNENVQSAGYQNIVWNGNSQNGSKVSSGVYFYRFKATSLENNGKVYEKTAKLLLLK